MHATITCADLTVQLTRSNRTERQCDILQVYKSTQEINKEVSKNVNEQTIYKVSENSGLTNIERRQIDPFLAKELPKFQKLSGLTNVAEHKIIMKDDRPIKIRNNPRNPAMQAIIDTEINKLIERGCIEPTTSPYSFPITLVKKKSGEWRTCMDFRQLNKRSAPDAYPLPRIDTILNRLRHTKFISSLDLKDGYWQIPLSAESRQYTAFAVTGRGLYQ